MQFPTNLRGFILGGILCALTDTGALASEVVMERFEVGDNIYVRALTADRASGRLWVGTSTGAMEIELASRAVKNVFTRDHGLANEYIFAIGLDNLGNTWFGTNSGGVSRYHNGDWKTFFPMHGLADYWVYAFDEHQDGSLWIGTWAGASRFDHVTQQFTNFREELVNEWVYGIDIDNSGRIWFGTEGGVSVLDGEEWRHWVHADGLGAPNQQTLPPSDNTGLGTRSRHDLSVLRQGEETFNPNYVFAMHVDRNQHVWAGTWGGGVSRFDGSSWSNLTSDDGLAGNIVYSIAEDDDGVMWFGTNHGLSRYENGLWTSYDQSDGLFSSDVYAIAVTDDTGIWAGTRGGVVRLDTRKVLPGNSQ